MDLLLKSTTLTLLNSTATTVPVRFFKSLFVYLPVPERSEESNSPSYVDLECDVNFGIVDVH